MKIIRYALNGSLLVGVLACFVIPSTHVFGQDFSGSVQLDRSKLCITLEAGWGFPWRSEFNRIHKFDYPCHAQPPGENVRHFPLIQTTFGGATHPHPFNWFAYAELDGVPERFGYHSTQFARLGGSAPPSLMVPLQSIELTNNFGLQDPTIPAEQVASAAFRIVPLGLDVSWRAMAWSYPRYDDFIITEFTFTNTGDHDVTNFRFGPLMRMDIAGDESVPIYADDHYEWDPDEERWYVRDARRWDASGNPIVHEFGLTRSDRGEPSDIDAPNSVTHDFRAAQYYSMEWLGTSPKSDPSEPNHVNFVSGAAEGGPTEREPEYFESSDPAEWFLDLLTYDEPLPATTEEGDPIPGGRERTRFDLTPRYVVSAGPFDVPQGESVTMVLVQAVGMMSMERVAAGGLENEAHLIDGRDSLWANIGAAHELFENDYEIENHPPITPTHGMGSLEIAELGGAIKIQWPEFPADYQDPSTGVNDFAGFKIYRSGFRQDGPWNLLADIPAGSEEIEDGLVTYTDEDVLVGSPQFYAVTSYDTDGNESGIVNANPAPVAAHWEPSNDLDQVLVYPNPFRLHSGVPDAQHQIDFVNIPGHANIRIYTLAGSLVYQWEHDDGSGDATWTRSTDHNGEPITEADMVNQYHQQIVPGIYLFEVENLVQGHEGETRIGKFVIIK